MRSYNSIRFILEHSVFTFDKKFFNQMHETTMGTRFAPQYANIFRHRFEQDFFAAQNLEPTLYTRYTDDNFFLWTHSKESLKRLHSDINKFHPTIRLTMDYSSDLFRDATVKIRNDLLRRQTPDMSDRVPFIVQYFTRAEKLCHALHCLKHIIDDDEHLINIFPTPSLFTFKQPPNLKQTIGHSKLPSLWDNIDHSTTQPCHGNLCKTCQIIDMDATIT
eukprot:g24683.t1